MTNYDAKNYEDNFNERIDNLVNEVKENRVSLDTASFMLLTQVVKELNRIGNILNKKEL